MIKLTDGLLIYHGSYAVIDQIDLSKGKRGLDFGTGFYVTSSYEQAKKFVPNAVRKAVLTKKVPTDFQAENGYINVYRYHSDPNLLVHYFDEADMEWLHFVAANRDMSLFPRLLEKFRSVDIIGGKVADDNTARTLNTYIQGDLGIPGTHDADMITLNRLLPNRLEDQFCFRTMDAIHTLEFVRSDAYNDIR